MAVSAAAVTAKLVALTLSDRNGRTVFFSVIAALVTPVILIVTMILVLPQISVSFTLRIH